MEETKNEDPIYHFQLKSYDLIEIVKFSKVDIWMKAKLQERQIIEIWKDLI